MAIKLRQFAHQSEAHLAKALLLSHGIEATALGSKVMVADEDFKRADKIITDVMAKDMILHDGEVNHFRKAVLFALGAPILIPVIFNVISLKHLYQFWQKSDKEQSDLLKVIFVLALQLLTVLVFKMMYGMFQDFSSVITLPGEIE